MGLFRKPSHAILRMVQSVHSCLPVKGIARPVFVIGCGRSGTTILGTALSRHREITYLNEPRKLWSSVYSDTDIWPNSTNPDGRLVLAAADADSKRSRKLQRLFRFETLRTGRPVLVEKFPVNSFRLQFVRTVFPDARIVYIHRNGLEVARSIERMCDAGKWYVANPGKWERLAQHAASMRDTEELPGLCNSYYEKGLLEWRLSTEAIEDFLAGQAENTFIKLGYAELVKDKIDTIRKVISFIGLAEDSQVTGFVAENIYRRSSEMANQPLTDTEKMIGGRYLLRTAD